MRLSENLSGLKLDRLVKDSSGKPIPVKGVYWSLTHKPQYVGAVVADVRVGIDLENILARKTTALLDKAAGIDEWKLAGEKNWETFHRFWTAKEAVLKAKGIGLKGLSACRVVEIVDSSSLRIELENELFMVEHFCFDGHIASVVKNHHKINWTVLPESPSPD